MALTAPSDLTATSSDADTIALAWENHDTYTDIYIEYNTGAGWNRLDSISGALESHDHDGATTNTLHTYRVFGSTKDDESGYSNTDSAACWSDTISEEVAASESVSDYATAEDVSDTITETIRISDFTIDAKDIITNYVYYVGTAAGGIYEYGGFYKSDAGTAIVARWESKDTDFADQDIESSDKFKTTEFIRLHYIDKSAGALITAEVSVDGGATWTTETKNIGTGDNKGKTVDFFIVKTGQIFRFAVKSASTSDEFQWTGLEAFYSVGGDYFNPS